MPYPRTEARAGEIRNGRRTQDRGGLTLSWEVTGKAFSIYCKLQSNRYDVGV